MTLLAREKWLCSSLLAARPGHRGVGLGLTDQARYRY